MPAPAPLLALESIISRDRLQARGQRGKRARFHVMQSHPNRARMLKPGERADAGRGDLEWRRPGRELMKPGSEPLQSMRIHCRSEKLERDMQICPRHPSDAVAWMLQLVDRLRHRLLDLLVHPDRDERAHSPGFAIHEVVVDKRSRLTFRPMRHWILTQPFAPLGLAGAVRQLILDQR